MTDKTGEGERRAKFRSRRWWGAMLGSLVFAFVGIEVLEWIYGHQPLPRGRLDPNFAIAASILGTITIALLAFAYHRIIDEQEERAALWGMTIGFYTIGAAGLVWYFLSAAGLVAPIGFVYVIFGGAALALAVQLYLQFR